jgi:hypothetical protein
MYIQILLILFWVQTNFYSYSWMVQHSSHYSDQGVATFVTEFIYQVVTVKLDNTLGLDGK